MKILNAYYDLKVSPTTYDVVTFLFIAEMWRLQHSLDKIDLFIVANDESDGFRDNEINRSLAEKEWILNHIILQSHVLLPSCRRTVYIPDRSELTIPNIKPPNVFPENYSIIQPKPFYIAKEIIHLGLRGFPYGKFESTPEAAKKIKSWISLRAKKRRVVTITLRNVSGKQSIRNSSTNSWIKFAEWIDKKTYFPVFIPDTSDLFKKFDDRFQQYESCRIASLNLELRMALYDNAYLNLLVNNGPNGLLHFNPNSRYIQFRPQIQGPDTEEDFLEKNGSSEKYDTILCSNYQKILMTTDELTNIIKNFNIMTTIIDNEKLEIKNIWEKPKVWLKRFTESGALTDALKILDFMTDNSSSAEKLKSEFNNSLIIVSENSLSNRNFNTAFDSLELLIDRTPKLLLSDIINKLEIIIRDKINFSKQKTSDESRKNLPFDILNYAIAKIQLKQLTIHAGVFNQEEIILYNQKMIDISLQRLLIFLQLNRITEMLDQFNLLNTLGADLSNLQLVWGKALSSNENYTEAIKKLKIHITLFPDDIEAITELSEAFRNTNNIEQYKLTLHELLDKLPIEEVGKISEIKNAIENS